MVFCAAYFRLTRSREHAVGKNLGSTTSAVGTGCRACSSLLSYSLKSFQHDAEFIPILLESSTRAINCSGVWSPGSGGLMPIRYGTKVRIGRHSHYIRKWWYADRSETQLEVFCEKLKAQ